MKALVTGGGGFLGGAIVRRLLERGEEVRSFSRHYYAHLREWGVEQCQGDLVDRNALLKSSEGCDIVFHVAACPLIWGPYDVCYRTNVLGTENVIAACRDHAIRRLVFTSSPSVVFDGSDSEGIDESAPYPDRYLSPYPKTKALAEQLVRQANDDSLATVSLRPHLIWGPGDNHLVPNIFNQARRGHLRLVGNGEHLVDSVYIDNAADAHLLAAERLEPGSPIAGKVYFISNNEPLPVKELINRILAVAGLPSVERHVSPAMAYFTGALMETIYRLGRVQGEPRMTRFLARQLSTAHWFDIGAAQRELGYEPRVSIEEGMQRLKQHFSEKQYVR